MAGAVLDADTVDERRSDGPDDPPVISVGPARLVRPVDLDQQERKRALVPAGARHLTVERLLEVLDSEDVVVEDRMPDDRLAPGDHGPQEQYETAQHQQDGQEQRSP